MAFFAELLKLVLVLIIVLAAAVYTIRFGLVRLQPDFARAGSLLKTIERLPLSQRNWLCLVQVGDRYLLLGVSATGITLVAELGTGEISSLLAQEAPRDFKSVLRGLKSRYNPGGKEEKG